MKLPTQAKSTTLALLGAIMSVLVITACPPPAPTVTQTVPVIEPQSISVPESQMGAFTMPIMATDPNGDRLSFRIIENTTPALFEIDMNTGVLSIAEGQMLDFETPPNTYTITVEVSDGTNSAQARITITVTNALETAGSIVQTGDLEEGGTITLNASAVRLDGAAPTSFLWSLTSPTDPPTGFAINTPTASSTTVTLPRVLGDFPGTFDLVFQLTVGNGTDTFNIPNTASISIPADSDGDGLIEIRNLTMLHNMRFNLTGASYVGGSGATPVSTGCPTDDMGTPADTSDDVVACNGYELIRDLDFDLDGSGSTYTASAPDMDGNVTYTLDADDAAPYFDATNGWLPLGDSTNNFAAIFNGNGFSIRNLTINRPNDENIGLIGVGALSGVDYISNVHLVDVLIIGMNNVGALAGSLRGNEDQMIINSSSGIVIGTSTVGGLFGANPRSFVFSNYSTANVTGNTAGGIGGAISPTFFISNYATGSVNGSNTVGSLVGSTAIISSFIANYATGNAVGSENVGNLLGIDVSSTINRSFGFGTVTDTDGGDSDDAPNGLGTTLPTIADGSRAINPSELTLERANGGPLATNVWNNPASNTMGAWDFTNSAANGGPRLLYNDYDGAGNRFHCASDAANAPAGAILIGADSATNPNAVCGMPLPHQN